MADQEASTEAREFVGFVWREDWSDRIGILVLASDASEAKTVVAEAMGSGYRISVWNQDEANAPR